jgi:hypothetical protein
MLNTWNQSGWDTSADLMSDEEPPEYRRSIELILIRNGNSPYQVFRGGFQSMPFRQWLSTDEGRQFLSKYGWNADERDADAVADRLERMNGPMSGDIILVPRYPDTYFEYAPLHGDHGGFYRAELEVPFVAVRSGAEKEDMEHIKSVLLGSIDMRTKGRPAVTDAKAFILNILKDPVPPKKVVEPPKPPEKDVVWVLDLPSSQFPHTERHPRGVRPIGAEEEYDTEGTVEDGKANVHVFFDSRGEVLTDETFEIKWSKMPKELRPGMEFEIAMSGTCTPKVRKMVQERPYVYLSTMSVQPGLNLSFVDTNDTWHFVRLGHETLKASYTYRIKVDPISGQNPARDRISVSLFFGHFTATYYYNLKR